MKVAQWSVVTEYSPHLTEGHVVTHIALEKEKEQVKYQPGMISGAGIEHINPDTQEIDFK